MTRGSRLILCCGSTLSSRTLPPKGGTEEKQESHAIALGGLSGSGLGHFCSYSVGQHPATWLQLHGRLGNGAFLAVQEEDSTTRVGDHCTVSAKDRSQERRVRRVSQPPRGGKVVAPVQVVVMGM